MNWIFEPIAAPAADYCLQAQQRQQQLTKPPGSLGVLEDCAARLAAMQRSPAPGIDRIHISVFAADHGIAAEGVSAFPQAVTAEMVKNFAAGGAAVNVLARHIGADFEVVDTGLLQPVALPNVIADRAGSGTANFVESPAMTAAQLEFALAAGRRAVARALSNGAQLFVGGEMGIANTTSASALAAACLGLPAVEITGAGTGLLPEQIGRKAAVIEAALQRHRPLLDTPFAILQTLGGFEIAALAGAYIAAAQQGLPVLVDGFISSVAALLAARLNLGCTAWFFFGHCSAEMGHGRVLQALQARPLLTMDMRLGEGSGAALAVPILQMACRLHNEMATFAEAGVSAG
ncbi:nicotinate-nucleotide--dimethylbenzimidazole phosphoribosyltransferase [Methylomonas sp. EFPC3]|uniref:nicotinate-nucleotide--dimethylbenzimidazole phosphoribosyltransferase n=1 Tax=Methylomonas sp. EFPC3 TaxID=3021710 RepID=UPI002416C014|nr:nicotinate-nucleotide--dimethylbenzimidazole phosphoribosyltransferase [Methylomonas sp. EFPC3]WFP49140.1 nicotinate-nucleotide--dimethylbenzimidazole phosphoribosyltransferase [Methylomonas sp. EFPC3]